MHKEIYRLTGLLLAALLAGCGPAPGPEEDLVPGPVGFDAGGAGSAPVHDIRAMSELALKIVQEAPAGTNDPAATTGRKIEEQAAAMEGSVLFPRWTARRVGASDYEVRFTFTHIDNQYNMARKGFSWIANVAKKTAGPMRVLRPEDFGEDENAARRPCDWEPMMFREELKNEAESPE